MDTNNNPFEMSADEIGNATLQEVFSRVVRHQRQQGRQAYDYARWLCRYRLKCEEQNQRWVLRCAVGCLMPDAVAVSAAGGIRSIPLVEPWIKALYRNEQVWELLAKLQDIHDGPYPGTPWIEACERGWASLAMLLGLELPAKEVTQ